MCCTHKNMQWTLSNIARSSIAVFVKAVNCLETTNNLNKQSSREWFGILVLSKSVRYQISVRKIINVTKIINLDPIIYCQNAYEDVVRYTNRLFHGLWLAFPDILTCTPVGAWGKYTQSETISWKYRTKTCYELSIPCPPEILNKDQNFII